jgi:hypothetical protein
MLYAVMLKWVNRYEDDSVIWTAWKNGKHSHTAGYGFRLSIEDRNQQFDPKWKTITIDLPHNDGFISVTVNVDSQAFWNGCCELRSAEIRRCCIGSVTLHGRTECRLDLRSNALKINISS